MSAVASGLQFCRSAVVGRVIASLQVFSGWWQVFRSGRVVSGLQVCGVRTIVRTKPLTFGSAMVRLVTTKNCINPCYGGRFIFIISDRYMGKLWNFCLWLCFNDVVSVGWVNGYFGGGRFYILYGQPH